MVADMSRTITITLTLILAASSLLWVEFASAQSIPTPSVPELKVRLVDNSYDVPATTPTYTVDPYTGQQKQVTSGSHSYRVENKTIELSIKNQPFTPYNDSEGHYIGLYYNLRYKGHYGTSWRYDPFTPEGESSKVYGGWDMTYLIPYTPSNSEYTTISMPLGGLYGEVDFQVQAQIGYIQQEGSDLMRRVFYVHYNFTGQSSDWSPIQTIALSESSASTEPTPSPTPSPSPSTEATTSAKEPTATPSQAGIDSGIAFGFSWEQVVIVAMAVVIVGLAAALVLSRRKRILGQCENPAG